MHGDDGLAEARRASDALFGDEPFADLDEQTLADAFLGAPSTELPPERLVHGIGLLELLVASGAAASNGEARRLVEQGGVRLNNTVADEPSCCVSGRSGTSWSGSAERRPTADDEAAVLNPQAEPRSSLRP
jgi:tyrosyl-tRNA synthetase